MYVLYVCMCVYVSSNKQILSRLEHKNGWKFSRYSSYVTHENGLIISSNVTHLNTPTEYFFEFDLSDKKFTIKETNDQIS